MGEVVGWVGWLGHAWVTHGWGSGSVCMDIAKGGLGQIAIPFDESIFIMT
jgi:hypothetical protein